MAPLTKKYCIYIIFLVSPVSLSLFAQSTIEKPTVSIDYTSKSTAKTLNQKEDIADERISKLVNSNQFIVGLSNPKDSSSIVTGEINQSTSKCEENTSITGSYSSLAKEIIENYRYDFSETFIDILFFDRIDLARTRTI